MCVLSGFRTHTIQFVADQHHLQRLPLRSTKSFLTYSVEKLDKSSAPYQVSCKLWQDGIPTILPELLQFLR